MSSSSVRYSRRDKISKQVIRVYGRKWSGPKCNKYYGSSADEKVFPAGEEQGGPYKAGGI